MNLPIVIVGIEIPCKILSSEDELLYELVLKNVFVLTINIAGMVLEEGTTSETLWTQHNEFARTVADEVIDVQEWLTEAVFQRKQLIDGLAEGINGDPQHKCKGRSAQGRLTRMLDIADEAGLEIPRLRDIRQRLMLNEHRTSNIERPTSNIEWERMKKQTYGQTERLLEYSVRIIKNDILEEAEESIKNFVTSIKTAEKKQK